MEGTYPLPEAQLDRFLMKILVRYPTRDELDLIVDRTVTATQPQVDRVLDRAQILEIRQAAQRVLVAPHVRDFATHLVLATQPEQPDAHPLAKKYIRYGSSPRGAQALIQSGRILALMRGRWNASVDDLKVLALPCLRHRLILNFDAHAEGKTADALLTEIMGSIPSRDV
jgi:MoxR-like ATPase